ncbi:MAG TPA: FecR domain-containing protein [Steroidobacteraceae bacterium]|nr:FecR domain-containing protein [Steroidobacteraceae bacterium]
MASGDDIEACAADWLARLDRPEAPAGEHEAFEAWCRADPRHVAVYLRLLAVWNRLDALKPPERAPAGPHSDAARVPDGWARMADRRLHRPIWRRRTAFAVALAAGLAAVVAGLAWWQGSTPFQLGSGVQRYSTTLGGFRQITLADGSVVELNTDSELTVRLRRNERELTLLQGEATFEVAPDKSRPFIVVAGSTRVRAVGTVFNVQKSDASVEVLVTKGVVAVGPPHDGTADHFMLAIVDAGQMAIAASSHVTVQSLDQEEIARRLAWHEGMLLFNGQTLADVAAQFNRYNERKLVIADPTVGRVRIGGYFRATDLDSFVRVLQERFGIVASQEPGRILLRR